MLSKPTALPTLKCHNLRDRGGAKDSENNGGCDELLPFVVGVAGGRRLVGVGWKVVLELVRWIAWVGFGVARVVGCVFDLLAEVGIVLG
jgi:hypothetical protein